MAGGMGIIGEDSMRANIPTEAGHAPGIWISFKVDEANGILPLMALIAGWRGLQLIKWSEQYWMAILQPGGASTLERPA